MLVIMDSLCEPMWNILWTDLEGWNKDKILLIIIECAATLNDTSGEIKLRIPGMQIGYGSSFYYENGIENDCIWLIQMDLGQLIQINFIAFQTLLGDQNIYYDCM